MKDLISIVIPAYNAEKLIGECLERLLKQSYKDIEVIVMNDGSIDSTLQIAESFANKDSRVKVFSQENSGSSVARINGAMKATGKYILFLDSDDFFVDNAIDRLVEVANKYDTDLIKFRLQTYPDCMPQPLILKDIEKDTVIYKKDFNKEIYPLFIDSYSLNANGTLMVKKSSFKVKDINSYYKLRFAEDLKLSLELFDDAQSVTIISDVLYNYVTNYSSITKSNDIDKILYNIDNFVKVYTILYKYLEKWNIDSKENVKKIDIKVLRDIALFYTKIKFSDDQEYVRENKDKIRDIIYSDMVIKALNNINENELYKTFDIFNSLIEIYKREL